VILPGVNHVSLITGDAPYFVKTQDLMAEVSKEEGQSEIAKVLTAYFGNDATTLNSYMTATEKLVEPLVWAFEKESSRNFNGKKQWGGP